jgi:hypothetical protein
MALLLLLIFLCFAWFVAVMMASRATVQKEVKIRDGLRVQRSSPRIWISIAYVLSAVWGIVLGGVLIHTALASMRPGSQGSFPKVTAFFGVWATFVVIQLTTNCGRQLKNLPSFSFRWFPQMPKLPATPAGQLALETRTADRFLAMELMPFYWNRFYSVFITDHMLCGARARFGALNISLNPRGLARSITFDPKGYVRGATPSQYNDMDVSGPAFLAADPANFQIAFREISSIELQPGEVVKSEAGFGLGGLRQSGALVLFLKSGATRQLILLGDQDGATLKQRMEDLVNGAAC